MHSNAFHSKTQNYWIRKCAFYFYQCHQNKLFSFSSCGILLFPKFGIEIHLASFFYLQRTLRQWFYFNGFSFAKNNNGTTLRGKMAWKMNQENEQHSTKNWIVQHQFANYQRFFHSFRSLLRTLAVFVVVLISFSVFLFNAGACSCVMSYKLQIVLYFMDLLFGFLSVFIRWNSHISFVKLVNFVFSKWRFMSSLWYILFVNTLSHINVFFLFNFLFLFRLLIFNDSTKKFSFKCCHLFNYRWIYSELKWFSLNLNIFPTKTFF